MVDTSLNWIVMIGFFLLIISIISTIQSKIIKHNLSKKYYLSLFSLIALPLSWFMYFNLGFYETPVAYALTLVVFGLIIEGLPNVINSYFRMKISPEYDLYTSSDKKVTTGMGDDFMPIRRKYRQKELNTRDSNKDLNIKENNQK